MTKTLAEAATSLGVAKDTVRKHVEAGRIVATRRPASNAAGFEWVIEDTEIEARRRISGQGVARKYQTPDRLDPTRITQADAARLLGVTRSRMSEMARQVKYAGLGWNGTTFDRAAVEALVVERTSQRAPGE